MGVNMVGYCITDDEACREASRQEIIRRYFKACDAVVRETGSDNEVWSFGEEAYPILEKYMHRREALRPYVRQLMAEAHENGTPLLRGMYYEFPDDPACDLLQDQYMFGSRYLAAPVMEAGARSRSVYFPAGMAWKNVETGEIITGGQRVDVAAPLDVIPVFERL